MNLTFLCRKGQWHIPHELGDLLGKFPSDFQHFLRSSRCYAFRMDSDKPITNSDVKGYLARCRGHKFDLVDVVPLSDSTESALEYFVVVEDCAEKINPNALADNVVANYPAMRR